MSYTVDRWMLPRMLGIEQTVAEMRKRVEAGFRGTFTSESAGGREMTVRRACEFVVKKAPGGDRAAELEAIREWVVRRLQYRRDPTFTELLIDPRVLLARIDHHGWAAGDCDDATDLICTLGACVRLPMAFVLCGEKDDPSHVYAAMRTGGTSTAWLAGSDSAASGLLAANTPSPAAVLFGVHPPARARIVVDALSPEDEHGHDPALTRPGRSHAALSSGVALRPLSLAAKARALSLAGR